MDKDTAKGMSVCEVIAYFILMWILLSILVTSCSCYYGSVSTFANVAKCTGCNMVSNTISVSHAESMKDHLKKTGNEPVMIAVLADFCVHCRNLKKSGELDKLAKTHKVFLLDEKHPESSDLMGMVGSGGFPTLIVYKKGQMSLYSDNRKSESMEKFMNSM